MIGGVRCGTTWDDSICTSTVPGSAKNRDAIRVDVRAWLACERAMGRITRRGSTTLLRNIKTGQQMYVQKHKLMGTKHIGHPPMTCT